MLAALVASIHKTDCLEISIGRPVSQLPGLVSRGEQTVLGIHGKTFTLVWTMEGRKNNGTGRDVEQSMGPGSLDSDSGARVQQLRDLYMEPLNQLILRTETGVMTDRSNKQIVFFKKILNFLRDSGQRNPMTNIFYFEKILRKLFGPKGNLSTDTRLQQASTSAAKSSANYPTKKQRPNEGANASSTSQSELMNKIQKASADCKKNLERMLKEKYVKKSNSASDASIPKVNQQPSETKVSSSISAQCPPEPSTHAPQNTDFMARSSYNVKPCKLPSTHVTQSIISEVRSRMLNKLSSRKRVHDLEANNVTKAEGLSAIKQTRTCTPSSSIELNKQTGSEKTTGTNTSVSRGKHHVIPPSTKPQKMPLQEQTQATPANANSQAVPANTRAQRASSDAKLPTNNFYGQKHTSSANSSPDTSCDFTQLFTDMKKDLQRMRMKVSVKLNANLYTSNVNSSRHQAKISDKPPVRASASSDNSFPANANAEKTGTPSHSRKRPFLYNSLTIQFSSAADSATSTSASPVTSQTRTSSVQNENSTSTATVSSASRRAARPATVSSQVKGQQTAGLSPVKKLLPASMKPVTQLRTGADRPVPTPGSLNRATYAAGLTAATSDIPSRKPIKVPTRKSDSSVPEQRTSPAQRAYLKYAQRAASLNDLNSRVPASLDDKKTTIEGRSATKPFSTKTTSFKSSTIPVHSGARPTSVKSPTIPVNSGARPTSVKSPTIPVNSGARPTSVKSPTIPVNSGARPSTVKSPTIPVTSGVKPPSVKSPTIPVNSPAQRAYAKYAQRAASFNDLHSRVPASLDDKKPPASIFPSNSGKTKATVINPKSVDKPSAQSTPRTGQSQKLSRSSSAPQRTATNLARTKHVPGKWNEMEGLQPHRDSSAGTTPVGKHGSVRCTEASSTTSSSSEEESEFLQRRNSRFLNFVRQHTAVSETDSASQTPRDINKTSATKEEPSDTKSGNDYTSKFDKYYTNLTEVKDRGIRSSSTLKRPLGSTTKSLNEAGVKKTDSKKPKSSFLKTMASIAKAAQAGQFLFDKNPVAGTSRTSVSSESVSASVSRPPLFANSESSKQRKLSNSKPVSAAYSNESHAGSKYSFDRDSLPSAIPLASSSRSPAIASTVSSAAPSTAPSKASKLAVPSSLTLVSSAPTISSSSCSVAPSSSVVSGSKASASDVSGSKSSASAVSESKPSGSAAESASSGVIEPEKDSDSECIVCFENPVNTVIYSCGHMCLCFECATMVKEKKKECPVCRETIKDIIKTYKS